MESVSSSSRYKDELTVDAQQCGLLKQCQRRIEELHDVKIEFDFTFKDKNGRDEQQWLTVQGIKDHVKSAKDYIKALCNPVESTCLRFPPEMYTALSDPGVWKRLEKDSHAVLFFPSDDSVTINGSDTLSVTLAMSALEDIISHFNSWDAYDSDTLSPLSRQTSQTSQRLDDELRRLSSEKGSLILTDNDPVGMKDEVKRAILTCFNDPEFDPSDFNKQGGFHDLRQAESSGNYQLLPPDHFTEVAAVAVSNGPYMQDLQLNLTEDPVPDQNPPVDPDKANGQSEICNSHMLAHAFAHQETALRGDDISSAFEAFGLPSKLKKDDPDLWTFAFDQGFKKNEIENVLKEYKENVDTGAFLNALMKSRTKPKLSRKKFPSAHVKENSGLNAEGFPTTLPIPPSKADLQTGSQNKKKPNGATFHYNKVSDTSLPPDYLQLFEDEGLLSEEQLKERNEERRKILEAAFTAEPEVRLNSKSNTKGLSKSAKKRNRKRNKKGTTNTTGKSDIPASRRTPSPDPSDEDEECSESTPNVAVENTFDILDTHSYGKVKGESANEGIPKTASSLKSTQPAFIPSTVEFTQWGKLKEDSMCRSEIDHVDKEPESMPWSVATKKPKQKARFEAETASGVVPGLSQNQAVLHSRTAIKRSQKGANLLNGQPTLSRGFIPPPNLLDGSAAANPGYRYKPLPVTQNPSPPFNMPPPGVTSTTEDMFNLRCSKERGTTVANFPSTPGRKTNLRYIVIDGSNVAMTHGNGKIFSCRGIQLCVEYFLQRGHREITVFVPQWRTRQPSENYPMSNQEIIFDLKQRGFLTLTPARRVQGKNIVCYDDRFILKLAQTTDGIVVSNDNYRDLWREKLEWRQVIENRLLMYSFVGDIFMVPDDPLGPEGPILDAYLTKPDGGFVKYFPSPKEAATTNTYTLNSVFMDHRHIQNRAGSHSPRAPLLIHNGYYTGTHINPSVPTGQAFIRGAAPVNHFHNSGPAGAEQGSPNIQITQWGSGAQTELRNEYSGTGVSKSVPGQNYQIKTNAVRERSRSPTLSKQLFLQLNDVFPDKSEKIHRILENHPNEESIDKLSAYLLEIL